MYKLLVRLMVISALAELGLSWKDISDCRGRACILRIERAALAVLHVDWRPISLFPKEARKFQKSF